MVKFGRHLQFYLESEQSEEPYYVVPYGDVRECIGESQHAFIHEWRSCLRRASEDYANSLKKIWNRIFNGIISNSPRNELDECRGLRQDKSIQVYLSMVGAVEARELFSSVKSLYSTAAMNCEGLRKVVKKFDKSSNERGDDPLSSELLPELYSAALISYPNLESLIETFRDALIVSEDEDDDDSERHELLCQKDARTVKKRAGELAWLKNLLASIPTPDLSRLVAHRGFHSPHDMSDRRPLENSLSAFEAAWCGGVHLCECDVALTKDEKLVLAHDEDFSRLALDPLASSSKKMVSDLTMKEIISLTFKSGTRPPLLLDVLRSAHAIGGESKLVIEIKPGNSEACSALVRLFDRHPELMDHCAAIMSFDLFAMHTLRSEFDELIASKDSTAEDVLSPLSQNTPPSPPSKLSNGFHHRTSLSQPKAPKILLITVAEEPQEHYELWVNVEDVSPVKSWLTCNETGRALDGIYMQYQPEMHEPSGISAMKKLSERYEVGVWGYFGKAPDDLFTARNLIRQCGVSYVNTDLPRKFCTRAT